MFSVRYFVTWRHLLDAVGPCNVFTVGTKSKREQWETQGTRTVELWKSLDCLNSGTSYDGGHSGSFNSEPGSRAHCPLFHVSTINSPKVCVLNPSLLFPSSQLLLGGVMGGFATVFT